MSDEEKRESWKDHDGTRHVKITEPCGTIRRIEITRDKDGHTHTRRWRESPSDSDSSAVGVTSSNESPGEMTGAVAVFWGIVGVALVVGLAWWVIWRFGDREKAAELADDFKSVATFWKADNEKADAPAESRGVPIKEYLENERRKKEAMAASAENNQRVAAEPKNEFLNEDGNNMAQVIVPIASQRISNAMEDGEAITISSFLPHEFFVDFATNRSGGCLARNEEGDCSICFYLSAISRKDVDLSGDGLPEACVNFDYDGCVPEEQGTGTGGESCHVYMMRDNELIRILAVDGQCQCARRRVDVKWQDDDSPGKSRHVFSSYRWQGDGLTLVSQEEKIVE